MKKEWSILTWTLFGVVFVGAALSSINALPDPDDRKARDVKEEELAVDQLPAPVKATLSKEAGAGTIEEVEKTTRRGRTVYEVDVVIEQQKWELTIREDGQLLKKELDEEHDDADDDKD